LEAKIMEQQTYTDPIKRIFEMERAKNPSPKVQIIEAQATAIGTRIQPGQIELFIIILFLIGLCGTIQGILISFWRK
jgi:hypothetical protein